MHRRALRRLPLSATITTHATPTHIPCFTQALQAAASRAWVRRAPPRAKPSITAVDTPMMSCPRLTNYGRSGPGRELVLDKFRTRGFATRTQTTKQRIEGNPEEIPIPDRASTSESAHARNITLEAPSPVASCSTSTQQTYHKPPPPHYDVDRIEPRPGYFSSSNPLDLATNKPCHFESQPADTRWALIEPVHSSPPPKLVSTPQTHFPKSLPTPTSRRTLYDNLRLSLTIKPLPRFPALVDYHDSHPEFRSTDSYNLLIELSIRHAQFGVTAWLFDAMVMDKIPWNSLTRTLSIRLLVRTGRWEQAWTQVTGSTPDEILYRPLRNGRSPAIIRIRWYLWLELLFTSKRGALRRTRPSYWDIDEDGNPVHLPTFEIVNDPTPNTKAFIRRQRLMACTQPVIGSNWKGLRPSLMKGAVFAILRDGRTFEAVELTKVYFSMLPQMLSDENTAQCMSIIHLLLSADTGNGLASMYAKRKLLLSMLKLHSSFKPSPMSLFHILTPLKGAKKSGTVAFKVMNAFRKSWGADVVDTRVRRRVGTLAQKEGRPDIVQAMLDEEWQAQEAAKSVPISVVTPSPTRLLDLRGLRRPSNQNLFFYKGTQRLLWTKFQRRVRWKQRIHDHTLHGTE